MKLSNPKVVPLKTPYRITILKSRAEKTNLQEFLSNNDSNLLFHSKAEDSSKPLSALSTYESSNPMMLSLPSLRKPSSSLSPFPKQVQGLSNNLFLTTSSSKGSILPDTLSKTSRYLLSPSPGVDSNKLIMSTSRSYSNIFAKDNKKEVSLVNSHLNTAVIQSLASLLNNPSSTLHYLNLENSGLTDKDVQILSDSLGNDRNLHHLGLARNNLNWVSGKHLKNMLVENYHLIKLDLHWNNLKDLGTAEIFEGLCSNGSLKELDLSWNSIGKCRNPRTMQRIADCFKSFEGLAHLDLSFNYLNVVECQMISKGLADNCEIVGIHIVGNEAEGNPQGFILPRNDCIQLKDSHLFTRIFQEGRKFRKPPNSFCWLCEQWTEVDLDFEIDTFSQNLQSVKAIFIHFQIDDYQGDYLPKVEGKFRISRVLPVGVQRFFFSLNGECFINTATSLEVLSESLIRTVEYSETYKEQISTHEVNFLKVNGRPCDYKNPFRTLPRRPRFGFQRVSIRQPKVIWSKDRSLFKEFHFYGQDFYEACVLFDWEQSKLPSMVKSSQDQQALKGFLGKIYPKVLQTFKNLSIQSANEFPSVGNNVFIDFLNQGQAFDGLFNSSDLGVNWNAVIVPKKRQPFNPGASLVRYEFVEILVRISHDRYVRNKVCKNVVEAFQYFVKENLEKLFENFFSENWRNENLYLEDVDNLLRCFKPAFEAAFKNYSGRKALPGQKPFMSLEEFKAFCFDSHIFDSSVPARDVESSFFLSMCLQVDELFEKRHLEMSFIEFLEAFCRAVFYSNSFNKEKSFRSRVFSASKMVLKVCPKLFQDSFTLPSKASINSMRVNPKK